MDRLDELGMTAWDTFYTQRQTLYGLTDGRRTYFTNNANKPHKYYKAFRTIAELCLRNNIDVTDYITTCFTLVIKNHVYITPKDFTTTAVLNDYIKNRQIYGEPHRAAWSSQSSDLADMVSRLVPDVYSNVDEILIDYKTPFTAWFRIFVNDSYNEQLGRLYGSLAWTELRADRALRDYLREIRKTVVDTIEQRFGYFGDVGPEVIND